MFDKKRYMKLYRTKNKTYISNYNKNWRLFHKDYYRMKWKEYVLNNREKVNENISKFKIRHPNYYMKYMLNWRMKNRKHCREYSYRYRKLNMEKCRIWKKVSYSRKKAIGLISTKTIQLVYEDNIKKYGTLTCYLCLNPIEFGNDHIEHKQPISRGGTNEYNNLEVSCSSCNCKKNNKTVEEFNKYKDFCEKLKEI